MKNLNQYISEKLVLSKRKIRHNENKYFYHEALTDGYTTKFIYTENVLQYSIDECNTWHELKSKTPEINKGQRIYFKGENLEVTENDGIGSFKSTHRFNIGGNIMSLIYGDDFAGKTKILKDYQFSCLFYENDYLESAKDLLLPALELSKECYSHMFDGCSSLIEAPELSAVKLSDYCYTSMFYKCEELKKAPELPASTLTEGCYQNMFKCCWALDEAPELSATKLVDKCYAGMFYNCLSLDEITMLANDISAYDCLSWWVYDISDAGTFTKAKGVDIEFGENGIPNDWEVEEI